MQTSLMTFIAPHGASTTNIPQDIGILHKVFHFHQKYPHLVGSAKPY